MPDERWLFEDMLGNSGRTRRVRAKEVGHECDQRIHTTGAGGTQYRVVRLQSDELGGFRHVIFTELANQDPLSPSDSSELLDQMNSIRSIESDLQMMNKLESLVFENQLSSASSMIGNFVGGLTPEECGWVDTCFRSYGRG